MPIDRFKGFTFCAADLSEDADLELELRKEILFAEAHLARWSHWEALGIPWDAPCSAARAAYLEKIRVFHPDRYGGRRLGSYRARLERVCRRLTEARDALSTEEARAAYASATAPPEERARREARRIEDERRAGERRARLARANPLVARAGQVGELVRRGKAALAEGRVSAAANDLLLAQGLDPRNRELAALADEARRKAAAARANELVRAGLEADARGNASAALEAFREALALDAGNVRAAAHGATAAARAGDLAAARRLADAALQAGPQSGLAHEALGIVLEADGDRQGARKALERALELDPRLERAKARLRKLRWGFLG